MKCWLTIDELDPLPLLLGGYPVKKLPAPVVGPEPAQQEALTTVAPLMLRGQMFKAGHRFAYCTRPATVVAHVIRAVDGTDYYEFITDDGFFHAASKGTCATQDMRPLP